MATYYIDPTNGNDSTGDGSYDTPYATLDKAHNDIIADSGDTIIIKDGYHDLTLHQTSKFLLNNQTVKSFTLEGETDATTCIMDSGNNGIFKFRIVLNGALDNNDKTITIRKLTVKNNNVGNYFFLGTQEFTTAPTGCNWTIENCIFDNCQTNNIGTSSGGTTTFRYNILLLNCAQGYYAYGLGYWSLAAEINCVHNLIIQTNDSYPDVAFRFIAGTGPCNIKNNIFVNNSTSTMNFFSNSTDNINFDNNCVYDPGDTWTNKTIITGDNNITSDPRLVDIANGNYNLRPDSPCIGTGALL